MNLVEKILNSDLASIDIVETAERLQFLKSKFGAVPENIIISSVKADPTSIVKDGEILKTGIYSQWLINQYLKSDPGTKSRWIEDLYKYTEDLSLFNSKKQLLPVDKRDINKLTLRNLYTLALQLKSNTPVSKRQQAIQTKNNDTIRVYEDSEWVVVIPLTYEASRQYGSGTRWCTAYNKTDTYFRHYSSKGPLFILIKKSNSEDQEKFQFHFTSHQFMDASDDEIDIQEFAEENKKVCAGIATFIVNYAHMPIKTKIEALITLNDLIDAAHLMAKDKGSFEHFVRLRVAHVLKMVRQNLLDRESVNSEFGKSSINQILINEKGCSLIVMELGDLSHLIQGDRHTTKDFWENVLKGYEHFEGSDFSPEAYDVFNDFGTEIQNKIQDKYQVKITRGFLAEEDELSEWIQRVYMYAYDSALEKAYMDAAIEGLRKALSPCADNFEWQTFTQNHGSSIKTNIHRLVWAVSDETVLDAYSQGLKKGYQYTNRDFTEALAYRENVPVTVHGPDDVYVKPKDLDQSALDYWPDLPDLASV